MYSLKQFMYSSIHYLIRRLSISCLAFGIGEERVSLWFQDAHHMRCWYRIAHNGKNHKIYVSYDERIFLPIARDSKKFKRIYKGRTSVERLNGRLDRDYLFEEHCIRGLKKMTMMVGLSMIIMNGMAIGKIKNGKEKIHSLKNAAWLIESDQKRRPLAVY